VYIVTLNLLYIQYTIKKNTGHPSRPYHIYDMPAAYTFMIITIIIIAARNTAQTKCYIYNKIRSTVLVSG